MINVIRGQKSLRSLRLCVRPFFVGMLVTLADFSDAEAELFDAGVGAGHF